MVEGSSAIPKPNLEKELEPEIVFSDEDTVDIHPHDNEPMVIKMMCVYWDINQIMVESGSSADRCHIIRCIRKAPIRSR